MDHKAYLLLHHRFTCYGPETVGAIVASMQPWELTVRIRRECYSTLLMVSSPKSFADARERLLLAAARPHWRDWLLELLRGTDREQYEKALIKADIYV